MKKLFLLMLLPALSFADRLGSLKSNADVLLTTQAVSGGGAVTLPLPGGATNYWNYPSSATFVDSQGVNASTVSANTISIGGASNTNGTVAVTGSGYFNGHLAAGDNGGVQSTIGIYGLGANGTTAIGVEGEVTPQTGTPSTAYGVFGQADNGGAVEYGVGGSCQATSASNCSGGTFTSTGGSSNSYGIQTFVSPTRASSSGQFGVTANMNGFAPSIYGMYSVVNSSATSAFGYYANLQGFSTTNTGGRFIAQSGTNNRGIDIDAGFGTNNYAIWANTGQSLFRDSVTVTSPLGEAVSYELKAGSATIGTGGISMSSSTAVFNTFIDSNTSTAQTINWTQSNLHYSRLTGNATYTFTAPSKSATLKLIMDSGNGGFTATWPASVKWAGGSAPTLTATANVNDIMVCTYLDFKGVYDCDIDKNFPQ